MEHREEAIFRGHFSYVNSVAITSDHKYIISGSDDKTVRIWNLVENKQEAVLEGHTDSVYSVAVTSDNKYIISGSDDETVRVWNLLEKKLEAVLLENENDFSSVRPFNLLEKKEDAVVQGYLDTIWNVAVTSDKNYFISALIDKDGHPAKSLEKRHAAILQKYQEHLKGANIISENKDIIISFTDGTREIINLGTR